TLIAAIDRNRAIGRGNALPWHLPDDFRHFKALTLGKTVLMGSHTARSLGRALPGRRNLVLTRSGGVPHSGMEATASLEQACSLLGGDEELMVIGGAQVYALTLPLAQMLYLTHVDTEVVDADAFFPVLDSGQWQCVNRTAHAIDERHAAAFEIVCYQRQARRARSSA
ncbi:MAG: diacylglycerol kinase, partial [Betaproteobacteria bacterium HGW-Betaproteobacteria-13]